MNSIQIGKVRQILSSTPFLIIPERLQNRLAATIGSRIFTPDPGMEIIKKPRHPQAIFTPHRGDSHPDFSISLQLAGICRESQNPCRTTTCASSETPPIHLITYFP